LLNDDVNIKHPFYYSINIKRHINHVLLNDYSIELSELEAYKIYHDENVAVN